MGYMIAIQSYLFRSSARATLGRCKMSVVTLLYKRRIHSVWEDRHALPSHNVVSIALLSCNVLYALQNNQSIHISHALCSIC